MKSINISTLILSFLLFGCGPSKPTDSGRTKVTTPQHTQATGQTIHLKTTNKGSVNSLDLNITFPNKVQGDIYSYSGDINIKGTIDAKPNCLNGRKTFSCKANITVANIAVSNCSINGHNISLRIFIKRGGEQLKAAYSIIGVEVTPDNACYQSN